ncbi:MAG: transposase, partial [Campylobacterota bacterium]|nr:transposase [Campylobacterota bacterium]
ARLDYKNVMDYAVEMAMEDGHKVGYRDGQEKGLKKGLERGLEQGSKNKQLEIAKNLLDVLDIELIALKTGLSIEDIEQIK